MPTALVADDHAVVRHFIINQLKPLLNYHFEEASTGTEVIERLTRMRPDLIVLDLHFENELNGQEYILLVNRVHVIAPQARIFIYTSTESPYMLDAVKPYIDGMARKTDPFNEVFELLTSVLNGSSRQFVASKSVNEMLGAARQSTNAIDNLSENEMWVLLMLVEGASTTDMAKRLGKSEQSMDLHRKALRQKFGVGTTNELIAGAVRYSYDVIIRQKLRMAQRPEVWPLEFPQRNNSFKA